jgi:hypothetical protein
MPLILQLENQRCLGFCEDSRPVDDAWHIARKQVEERDTSFSFRDDIDNNTIVLPNTLSSNSNHLLEQCVWYRNPWRVDDPCGDQARPEAVHA